MHISLAIAVSMGLVTQLQAQSPAPPGPSQPASLRDPSSNARAHRVTKAPDIDGSDADEIWRVAPKIDAFKQFEPKDGADPSFKTEFQVGYDDRNIFVFIRAYDPHPDSIRHALTRRDVRGPSDQLKLIIDAFNDNRTGFEFAINPDGVKRDFAVYDDGNEDGSWNAVWDAAAQVDSLGWTAEFRIPLSQLRYAHADSHIFGFGVWRDIERFKERVSWPRFERTKNGFMSQMGDLDGIGGIRSPGTLEVTPYTVTKNLTRTTSDGYERKQEIDVGGDLKYGITPNVTLNATVNPDFGQVEADPAVLNLSAFETFLSERRPFFVEGTGQYQFRLNCYIVVDCSTNEGLFYSRRIGRSPFLRGTFGDEATPAATPIIAATKLTGRTPGGFSFGVLDALTQSVEGTQERTVEPLTNYAVVSARQDLRKGSTGINLIATGVNRSLDEWTNPYLHHTAYAGGASFRNRFAKGRYEFEASLTGSRVEGTPEVIARTQRNAVHYYQQPGDDLDFDSTRTSLVGHSEQLKFGKYGGGITRFETSLVHMSPGFDVNDLGFLRRADLLDWSTWAALSFRTQRWIYRWAQVNGNHWERWNTSGLRLENAFNTNGHIGFKNNWGLHAGATIAGIGETYCDRCTRGGPVLRNSTQLYPWFGIQGDDRHVVVPFMWVNLSFSDEGRSQGVNLSPSVDLKLSTRLQTSLGANIDHTQENTQWFGNFTENGVTHYTFAHLNQRTVSMNVRINYTARPNLTLEFYGEPFATAGTYSNVRELSATPNAARYADRFVRYAPPADADLEFDFTQLRTNTVVRWEYLPGSTLFLVWAHGRERFTAQRQPSWRDDYRDLFEQHPDNTFLIKVAYWLNR